MPHRLRLMVYLTAGYFTLACGGSGGGDAVTAPGGGSPPSPPPAASVSLNSGSASVVVGGTAALSATVKDANGNTLTDRSISWASSSVGVVTVTQSGGVTGISVGSAVVTATAEGKSGSATVTVTLPAIATIVISPATGVLTAGSSASFSAVALDAAGNQLTGRQLTWASTNSSIATVATTGVVSALAPGQTTISASAGEVTGTAVLTVVAAQVPVATVTLAPPSGLLQVGSSGLFTVTLADAAGSTLTNRVVAWASSNPAIATVNATTGIVTAFTVGTTQITATSEGRVGTATLTVTAPPVTVCSLIAGATVLGGDGQALGTLTNQYNATSVENQYGIYGSPYSATSIFNQYGKYGGQFGAYSPFNPYTQTPPVLVINGHIVAYLSVNQTLVALPIVSPTYLSTCAFP